MADSITRERLKEIVEEELDNLIGEATIDHKGISTIVTGASTLLGAIDKFEAKASPTMTSSLGVPLKKLKQTLHDMVTNPSSYVMVPKKVRKVVTLAPASGAAKAPAPVNGAVAKTV
jgi:hypothetical protein